MWLIDLHDLKARWRDLSHGVLNTCLGAVFVAIAVSAIGYHETIAPGLSRMTDAWTSTAGDLTRRFVETA